MPLQLDSIFRAAQDIAFNQKVIANSEKKVRMCEEELIALKEIAPLEAKPWWAFGFGRKNATSLRVRYLTDNMLADQRKIEKLEREIEVLKKVLAKGG